jgi:hypothetical protein
MAECTAPLHDSPLPLIGAATRIDTDVAAMMMSTEAVVQLLVGLLKELPPSYARRHLIETLATVMEISLPAIGIDPSNVDAHLIAAARTGTQHCIPFRAETMQSIHVDFYDALGSSPDLLSSTLSWSLSKVPIDLLLLEFCAHPARVGLLKSIVACIAAGAPLLPATLSRVAGHAAWNEHPWAHLFVQICRTDLGYEESLALAAGLPKIVAGNGIPGTLLRLLILTLRMRAANASILQPILLVACALIPATQWELLADAKHVKHRFSLAHMSELSSNTR